MKIIPASIVNEESLTYKVKGLLLAVFDYNGYGEGIQVELEKRTVKNEETIFELKAFPCNKISCLIE